MPYKSFTFQQLKELFGVEPSLSPILSAKVMPVEPSEWLWRTLEISSNTAVTTAKERSERIISPVLLESRERNNRQFSIFSGWSFDVDISRGLNGECDFLLSSVPLDFEIKVPVFALRETKGGEIESCLPQCAAQMVAAQLFNEDKHNSIPAVFGCVTTGVVWRFLKLEGKNLIIDADVYCLDNVPMILGVLQTIVNLYQ
ncbi:hypothetical protein NDI47_17700 [Microcoleus vaginatus GB1-A2]|uniref:hypothetical protein n=1 Tax=Microcoleus vaginatus TaxID=119532 RepID=UPI001684E43C|nr:hypothetical protein [Microcoleus sp. FACHB-61]